MVIKRASETGHDIRRDISQIFAEGFGHWLTFFSKDVNLLAKTFTHMFLPDKFYVALIDGEITGITACTDGKTPPIKLDKKELKRHLGFIKGSIAARVLKTNLEEHPYPFPLDETTGSIEYVATSTKFRRRGVAGEIIRHIIDHTDYQSYVLEVADTNINAVKLYEKLGFREIHRVKEKHTKQSGINYFVYMKYVKEH